MTSLLLQTIYNLLRGKIPEKTFVVATILIVLVVAISSITALVVLYPTLTGNSTQNQNNSNTSLQKQFGLSIAYAYVGKMLNHSSYIGDNGVNMSLVSKYASSVILNSTRLPGVQIASCDGEIEVFKIQVTTDTNLTENLCYYIGTNYNPSFSSQELMTLFKQTQNLSGVNYIVTMGGFHFNMTDNESLLSTPIGSYGAYSSGRSGEGLWSAGKPSAISVTAQRIGYLTISNGSVTIHKEALNEAPTISVSLSNYGNGFLYNDLVDESKLRTIDLFHPISPTS
jgi:hypothetical protein